MQQECSPIPVPYHLREQFVAGDDFLPRMREKGWSVASTRPAYTDPEVIRQPWLLCPTGVCYFDHAFYDLFSITRFRKLLRTALLRTPCPIHVFASLCPDISALPHFACYTVQSRSAGFSQPALRANPLQSGFVKWCSGYPLANLLSDALAFQVD